MVFLLFGKCNQGYHNLFHRFSSVLERVFVISHIIVVVVGVCKEIVVCGENVSRADIGRRQSIAFGRFYLVRLFGVVAERFSHFIAEVCIGVFVADNLDGVVDVYGSVVGGENDFEIFLGDFAEKVEGRRVFEPRFGDGPRGGFGRGQFPNHFGVGTGVGETIEQG